MLKVFLVEDESVIREMLKTKTPWEEYGYKFVGEASDGEMALPLIRKLKPNLLITDIKMPFMDGLELSKIISSEFPDMKIVIISGYDDFEYARTALELGVAQYLLKPITKLSLRKTLLDLREKFEQDSKKQDYQMQYQDEMLEYEQFARRSFFEKIFRGDISVSEMYEEAAKLSLDIMAGAYDLIFLYMEPKQNGEHKTDDEHYMLKQKDILYYILRHPQYILFRVNVNTFGVLVKTDRSYIDEACANIIRKVQEVCEAEDGISWYVAEGRKVERLSLLKDVYQEVNRYLAYRFLTPELHVYNQTTLAPYMEVKNHSDIGYVDPSKLDPEIIKDFLRLGDPTEIQGFVTSYLAPLRDAMNSDMFRTYLLLNVRFTTLAYLNAMGTVSEEELGVIKNFSPDTNMQSADVERFFCEILQSAMDIREKESDYQSKHILRKSQEYIDSNYTSENLSLNEVAVNVGVSANYLSAIFSQNTNQTFIEYVTEKRMSKAKKMLKDTDLSSGEIASAVGYKDPHYFSFVFKKTQGISPREYRNGKKGQ